MRWRWGKEIVFNPPGGRIKGLRTQSSCLYNGITIMRQLFSWKLRGGSGNFRGKNLHRNDVPIDRNDSLTLYSPSRTRRSTPSLPPSSYCKCNQDRKWEREREGSWWEDGGGGELPEDIPVPRLNRKLGSRVISCFAEKRSCSGGQLKATNPSDITSYLQLRLDPQRVPASRDKHILYAMQSWSVDL